MPNLRIWHSFLLIMYAYVCTRAKLSVGGGHPCSEFLSLLRLGLSLVPAYCSGAMSHGIPVVLCGPKDWLVLPALPLQYLQY